MLMFTSIVATAMFFQGSNVLIKVYTALSTTSEKVAIFHLTNQEQKQKKTFDLS